MGQCWTNLFNCHQCQCEDKIIDSKNVHFITSMERWEAKLSEANQQGRIVIANFSTTWCKPCRSIVSAYCELADKYSSIIFLAIDVDELAELSTSWDIKATPTFIFLKDGRQVDRHVGANKKELQEKTAAMGDLMKRSIS